MKIYDLFSGFIAAVVIALGAGLYVNEDTSVGEELMVEEKVRIEQWFLYTGPQFGEPGYNPHDPELYQPYDDPMEDEPTCTGTQTVCAVKTETAISPVTGLEIPATADLDDLEKDINDLKPVTNLKIRNIL